MSALKPGDIAPEWLLLEMQMDRYDHQLTPIPGLPPWSWYEGLVHQFVCGRIGATYTNRGPAPKPMCPECEGKL